MLNQIWWAETSALSGWKITLFAQILRHWIRYAHCNPITTTFAFDYEKRQIAFCTTKAPNWHTSNRGTELLKCSISAVGARELTRGWTLTRACMSYCFFVAADWLVVSALCTISATGCWLWAPQARTHKPLYHRATLSRELLMETCFLPLIERYY